MKSRVVLVLGWCVGLAAWSEAAPPWGGNCLSCHSQLQSGLVLVYGEDAYADPDESATGAPDRGPLKVFRVYPGHTRSLTVQVTGLAPDDVYAVELARLRLPGVESGGTLVFSPDCDWPEWSETQAYYTEPYLSYTWGNGPTLFRFDIEVAPEAALDYYDLVFAVAGRFESDGGLFCAREHFYLQVLRMPGDLNCDGVINAFDIDPFILALTDPGAYGTQYPDCFLMHADINQDGQVNAFDIDPFIGLLTGK